VQSNPSKPFLLLADHVNELNAWTWVSIVLGPVCRDKDRSAKFLTESDRACEERELPTEGSCGQGNGAWTPADGLSAVLRLLWRKTGSSASSLSPRRATTRPPASLCGFESSPNLRKWHLPAPATYCSSHGVLWHNPCCERRPVPPGAYQRAQHLCAQ
jgi:hypothetical protein